MKLNNPVVAISGISLVSLPYLLSSLGASSFALGTLCAISIPILISFQRKTRFRHSAYLFSILIIAVSLNIIATSVYYQEFPSLQQFGGAFLSILLILYAELLTFFLCSSSTLQLNNYANFLVFMLIGLSIASLALGLDMLPYRKSILFFSEPSHFAIALSPFIVYTVLINKKLPTCFVVASVIILGVWLENLTLLLLSLISAIILMLRFPLGGLIRFILGCALILSFFLFSLSNEYFAGRVSLDTKNVSSLVYLRGFEASVASLSRPPFFGVGLQSMSKRAPSSDATDSLDKFNLGDLNNSDGGFVAAKILSEFGWPGLLGLSYFLVRSLPLLVYTLKLSSQDGASKSDNIFISCMVAVLIQLFVRGAGYLGPFLILAALAYYFRPLSNHSITSISRE